MTRFANKGGVLAPSLLQGGGRVSLVIRWPRATHHTSCGVFVCSMKLAVSCTPTPPHPTPPPPLPFCLPRRSSSKEVKLHLSSLLASSTPNATSTQNVQEEEEEEVAFGPTPAYSLSKAAANAAVRACAPQLASTHGVRLLAVCPGDVITRMSSEEEIARGEGVSPEGAALDVVDVALGAPDLFPGGKFYRAGHEISW